MSEQTLAAWSVFAKVPLMVAAVAFVICFMLMLSNFFSELFLLVRRTFRRMTGAPISRHGDYGWYTTNDWLALIGAIVAIVVIESQYDPPPRSILSSPGSMVLSIPTN